MDAGVGKFTLRPSQWRVRCCCVRMIRFVAIDRIRDQTITVDELAREAGMSPSHFSRVFKETLGSTPMQYVLAYRIEQAVAMMQDASRPLGDIALACGFADQAHFTRSFKQVTSQTPRQYRASLAS